MTRVIVVFHGPQTHWTVERIKLLWQKSDGENKNMTTKVINVKRRMVIKELGSLWRRNVPLEREWVFTGKEFLRWRPTHMTGENRKIGGLTTTKLCDLELCESTMVSLNPGEEELHLRPTTKDSREWWSYGSKSVQKVDWGRFESDVMWQSSLWLRWIELTNKKLNRCRIKYHEKKKQ